MFGDFFFFLFVPPHLRFSDEISKFWFPGIFFFSAEVWLFFAASELPTELEIQSLNHPESPHFSLGKLSASSWGKLYQTEKWMHLSTRIYLRISGGQRKNIMLCGTSGRESYIALPRVNISALFWFYHYVWVDGNTQQFCCSHIFYFMFILV